MRVLTLVSSYYVLEMFKYEGGAKVTVKCLALLLCAQEMKTPCHESASEISLLVLEVSATFCG
jgi:hypothetical protein